MTEIENIIAAMNTTETIGEKSQFIAYLTNMVSKSTIGKKDRDVISTLLEREFVSLVKAFESATCYREKNNYFSYANALMELTLALYGEPNRTPQSLLAAITQLTPLLKKARYLENEIDALFETSNATPADIAHLGETLSAITDEYQRGIFWSGVLHFAEKLSEFSEDTAEALHELFVREFSRLFTLPLDEDVLAAIELAADAVRYSVKDDTVALLHRALALKEPTVTFYTVSSLLSAGVEIDDETISILANDLEFASLTYELLKDAGQEARFPESLVTPEYLAMSDMVHWLVYPTELGQKPDAIEYIGSVTVEKIPYYIFRFCSNSNTLDDDIKGKWLIGWSAAEGNTFSNFDLYEDYEEKTVEKTLKKIKISLLY